MVLKMEIEQALTQLQDAHDTKERLAALTKLLDGVEGVSGAIKLEHVADSIQAVAPFLKDNNFKIVQTVLSTLTALTRTNGAECRSFLGVFLPPVLERLGDSKVMVRKAAVELLVALSEEISLPAVLDRYCSLRGLSLRYVICVRNLA